MTPYRLKSTLRCEANCPFWIFEEVIDQTDLEELTDRFNDTGESFNEIRDRLAGYLEVYAGAVARLQKAVMELDEKEVRG